MSVVTDTARSPADDSRDFRRGVGHQRGRCDLQEDEPDAERWLVYLLKNGLYNARPPLVNEITRARELFAVLAPSFEHEDYCPIDDWFRKDYA
jgi:hypothetical protein